MYPPLYPIALIFSKLLPYDFKNNFLTSDEEETEKTVYFVCKKYFIKLN